MTEEKTSSGIPQALFLEDVDSFMTKPENDLKAEKVLRNLDEQHCKYKFMELNLIAKRGRLKNQVPDLENSLASVKMLKKRLQEGDTSEAELEYLLSEQVFMKARVKPTTHVYLWLGANVMLEYNLDDAAELLSNNIQTAKTQQKTIENDLDFLRDQLTTTEVNMARVYNWDVKRRQSSKGSAAGSSSSAS